MDRGCQRNQELSDFAGIYWWRRGESNPRPKALRRRYYMLSVVFGFSQLKPDEQEKQPASPLLV